MNNNPNIMSVSPRTAFGLNFVKDHSVSHSYEEIDERLFDSYLDISGRKAQSPSVGRSSPASSTSSLSEEESDSSHHRMSAIGSGRKMNRSNNQRKRETKSNKKEEFDSDNDSLVDSAKATKKSTKSMNNNNNKKSSQNASQDESEKKQKSLYKTELCRNWEETNHCRYGMKCQYAHGAADLREIDRHPKYKTQKCRTFHQTGSCPYGARCTFRHFNLPGDALEMKNLEKEEEKKHQKDAADMLRKQQSILSATSTATSTPTVIPATLPTLKQQEEQRPSIFSADNQKVLQQNWFLNSNVSPLPGFNDANAFSKRNMMAQFNTSFDPEDSLLPSNAESLLPHQLLFDLESPDEEEEPARCPLRNYVNLPTFSNFQAPHHLPNQPQDQQANNCKTFFRPWLF